MKKCVPVGVGILMLAFTASLAAIDVVSDFSKNPLTTGGWSFGVGNNSNSQLAWSQPTSSLHVHLDSSLPTVRLDLPIGTTLTTGTDFTLSAKFSFTITSAPNNEGMQLAFGLVNHAITGGNRTGTPANFGSDNVFNTVEFNYFPNVSPQFGSGRTLTPAVFGAQIPGSDAFGNFASVFGSGSDLGDNVSPAVTELPQSTLLQATLNYAASTKTLTLVMQRVNGDLSLTTLETSVPPLNLSLISPAFAVDSLAIMAYQDGFNGDPFSSPLVALVADMDIHQIGVSAPAPEPASTLLLLSAGGVLALFRRRRA